MIEASLVRKYTRCEDGVHGCEIGFGWLQRDRKLLVDHRSSWRIYHDGARMNWHTRAFDSIPEMQAAVPAWVAGIHDEMRCEGRPGAPGGG